MHLRTILFVIYGFSAASCLPVDRYRAHNTVDAGNMVATISNQDAQTDIISQENDSEVNSNIFETNNGAQGEYHLMSNQIIAGNLQDTERNDAGVIEESQDTDNDKNKDRIIDNYGASPTGSGQGRAEYGVTNVDNMDAEATTARGRNKIEQDRDNNLGSNYFGTD